MGLGRRIWRPLAGLKSRPKAFYEGIWVTSTSPGGTKCILGTGKVFSGRNGEYLGSVGPLWWHMVEVENFESFEVLGTLWWAWGTIVFVGKGL